VSSCRYAAYGSNLHPRRLQKRVSSARLLGTCFSAAYELKFNKQSDVDGSGKCSIFPGAGGVFFAIYEIESSQKALLDSIEGVGLGYDHHLLQDLEYGDCQTYIANPAVINDGILPFDWYRELVLIGCAVHGFPQEYVRNIERIEPLVDPDDKRSREQWALVEALRNGH
jgi:hypothetical protein